MTKHELPQMVLKYKGIFDFDDIYKKVYIWLQKEEFEFHEKLYKNKPPELEIKWDAKRKVNGYIMYHIDFYFFLRNAEEIDVIKDGVKRKMTRARMELYLNSTVITGYENDLGHTNWTESPFMIKLQQFYDKFIIRKELDLKHEDVLYYLVNRLHAYIKELLDMQVKGNAY